MRELLRRFYREDEGQDLIEYALLAALIGVVTVAAMNAVQNAVEGQFNAVETALDGSGGGGS